MVSLMSSRYPVPVAAQRAQIITPPHHCALQMVCSIYADMLCWVFGQTSSPWSCRSKGHYFSNLLVSSDATLQTKAMLPCFLWRQKAFRQAIVVLSFSKCNMFNMLTVAGGLQFP